MKSKSAWIVLILLAFVLIGSRLAPHSANWSSVLALCLLSGFVAAGRGYLLLIPLAALAISDWSLGFYPGWGLNYIAYIFLFVGGALTSYRLSSFLISAFGGAFLFFLLSNLGVWWTSGMYPMTASGLVECYQMGLPFFRASAASTLIFMGGFYFVLRILEAFLPQVVVESVRKNG